MKHLLYLLFFLASYAYAQNPQLNATVRNNTLSPARVANALDASVSFATSGTNTYTITTGLPVYSGAGTYASGDIWNITVGNAKSSETITLNVDSEGAVSVKDQEGNDLAIGDLKAGGTYTLRHNGTHFRVINIGGGGSTGATAAGSTGNVQYKSAGGGLQAEAAFSYDSATNLLTVPAITAGSSSALTDGAAITITGSKHTLTSDEATITWTLSQTSDYSTTRFTLNATTTTWTFPAGALCKFDGTPSNSNVVTISGTTGSQYVMSIYKDGTDYVVLIATTEVN